MIRFRIHFFGNVQGVGFRYTTCSAARGFEVTGFVRNCSNGSVELVAEGESAEIERFLESLRDRMGEHIEREESVMEVASGEFGGFGIR
jgi:acylphosphatase